MNDSEHNHQVATALRTIAEKAIHSAVLMDAAELARLLRINLPANPDMEQVTFPTRRVRMGETLVHAGDAFQSLYVVRSGSLKTVTLDRSGGEQIVAFPIQSDVVGIDGIDAGRYASSVVALEDSEVVILPFGQLSRLARQCTGLETLIYRTISRELVRDQGLLWMLGSLGAEARVAAFLLNLSERFGAIGYSRRSFNLRMTRQEIGSYLGLKLETVSCALSAFDAAGWVNVKQKRIDIVDPAALRHSMEERAERSECAVKPLHPAPRPRGAGDLEAPPVTRHLTALAA